MTAVKRQDYVSLDMLLNPNSEHSMVTGHPDNKDFTLNISIERLVPEHASMIDDLSGAYVKGRLERYVRQLADERAENTRVYFADDLLNYSRMWNDLIEQSRFNPVYVVGGYEEMHQTNVHRKKLNYGSMNRSLHSHIRQLREDNNQINISTFTLDIDYVDELPWKLASANGTYQTVLEKGSMMQQLGRAFATVPLFHFLYSLPL